MLRFASLCFVALALPAVAACNLSSEGEEGNVLYTPRDCGRLSCDFAEGIGVGGLLNVQIQGKGGVSTAGVSLVARDPDLLAVEPIADLGGAPAWQLAALAPGVTFLDAVLPDDGLLDTLEVDLVPITGLTLENVLGEAVGPGEAPDYSETWTINADTAVSFQVTPLGDGSPTMGRFAYAATIDQPILDGLIDDDTTEGYLYFQVPAGEYAALFDDERGNTLDVLFVAQ